MMNVDHDERTAAVSAAADEEQHEHQQQEEASSLTAASQQCNEMCNQTTTTTSITSITTSENTTPLGGRKRHDADENDGNNTDAVAQTIMTPKTNNNKSQQGVHSGSAGACSNIPYSKKTGRVGACSSMKSNDNKKMTQESASAPLAATHTQASDILTQNPDSTQLGGDDDDEYADDDGFIFSPFSPTTTRRQLPWARIILPESSSNTGTTKATAVMHSAHPPQAASVDLIPRAAPVAAAASAVDITSSAAVNTNRATGGISFLGLDNLQPGDPFNEYVIGRSSHADIVALPPSSTSATTAAATADDAVAAAANSKAKIIERKVRDWAFCMISNRHCRIFCTLEKNLANVPAPPTTIVGATCSGGNYYNNKSSSSFHMQVYVEDMSGNGTLINKTALLRKGERRLLHSGDEICLVNPSTLRKKVKSKTLLQSLLHQHSFVFVNLLSQQNLLMTSEDMLSSSSSLLLLSSQQQQQQSQSQHSRQSMLMLPPPPSVAAAAAAPPSASSSLSSSTQRRRKAAVNVRALNYHNHQQPHNRSSFGGGGVTGILKNPPPPSPALHQPQQQQHRPCHHSPMLLQPASSGTTTTTTFASLLRNNNHPKTTTSSSSSTSAQQRAPAQPAAARRTRRRRVEEDYDIRDVLGMGTVGQVRRAVHRQTGQERAVKTMTFHDNYSSNNMKNNVQSATEIFQAEAAILQRLDHPYIVRLLDVYVSDTAVHLVMDLLPGGDLFDRIVQKGKYSEVASRRVMRRLLAAVSYLHQDCNIVHRDLKPENILLQSRDNDVNVQITDFGLAKPVQGDAALCCKTFCGTPLYFAPEVLSRRHSVQKRGRYGKPADQWSLGVILYVLLSGTPPFEVSHFGNMLDGAMFDVEFPHEHWQGISDQAKDLVRKLLVSDPQERLTVEQAMQHDWINTEDGDTHVFPLDDPKLQSIVAASSASTIQPNVQQQQQPQQVVQKRLFTAVTGKTTLAAASASVSVATAQHEAAENKNLVKNHIGEQRPLPQKRPALSLVAESTQISPEPALAGKKKRSDLEPSSFDCSEEEPNADNNLNGEEDDDAPDPPCQETAMTTTYPPRVSDVAPPPLLLARSNKGDSEPRRPLSPTSFNTNRDEMMKLAPNKNGHDAGENNHACSSLLSSSAKLHADAGANPTLRFGSSAFGVVLSKPQARSCEENDVKAAASPVTNLTDQQPVLEKDDILSDFSEKTESITSFGGTGGDSLGSFASKTAPSASALVVKKPEPRRLKKRKEQQQQCNSGDGANGSTTTSSVVPKRRRVSAFMSDSLATLEPMTTSTGTSTTKKAKGNMSKQRTTTRKTKEQQKSQKTQQQQHGGHQTTLSGWVKK